MITRSNQATIVQFMKRTPERVESGDFPRTWTDEMIEYCYHIIAFRCNKESRQGTPSPVRCIETGEIFYTAAEASRSMRFSNNAVNHAIHRGHRSGGYNWEYVDE
jgi:hypothetical protein